MRKRLSTDEIMADNRLRGFIRTLPYYQYVDYIREHPEFRSDVTQALPDAHFMMLKDTRHRMRAAHVSEHEIAATLERLTQAAMLKRTVAQGVPKPRMSRGDVVIAAIAAHGTMAAACSVLFYATCPLPVFALLTTIAVLWCVAKVLISAVSGEFTA